jgi:hypothetical protein
MDVLWHKTQPFPVHLIEGENEYMFRGYDPNECPVQDDFQQNCFKSANNDWDKKFEPLYVEFAEKGGVPEEDLTIQGLNHYADAYFAAVANEKGDELPFRLSPEVEELLPLFMGVEQYWITYGNDKAIRLMCDTFFKYLVETLTEKAKGNDANEKTKLLKYAYFSAHDTTLTGFMSGIQEK